MANHMVTDFILTKYLCNSSFEWSFILGIGWTGGNGRKNWTLVGSWPTRWFSTTIFKICWIFVPCDAVFSWFSVPSGTIPKLLFGAHHALDLNKNQERYYCDTMPIVNKWAPLCYTIARLGFSNPLFITLATNMELKFWF